MLRARLLPLLLLTGLLLPAQEVSRQVRVPVVRDTWVSAVGREADGNNGAHPRLKLKGIQEFSLLDLDPRRLKGRVVEAAWLHLVPVAGDRPRRLTLSTVSSPWREGTGFGYAVKPGGATYNHAVHPGTPWAWPGSDITAVIAGAGHTAWSFADPVECQGRLVYAIDPRLLALRQAGLSQGFCLLDDVGSEYRRQGNRFTWLPMRNRYVASREGPAASRPGFTVRLGPVDRQAPAAVDGLGPDSGSCAPGELRVRWRVPADRGGAGVVGFMVRWLGGRDFSWNQAAPVPAWLVPLAGPVGSTVRLHLHDLPLPPGEVVTLGVRAVDGVGNTGPPALLRVRAAGPDPAPLALTAPPPPPKPTASEPRVGGYRLAVIDPLDRWSTRHRCLLPPRPPGHLRANPLWDAGSRRVQLAGARNETLAFQVLLRGGAGPVRWRSRAVGEAPFPRVQAAHYRTVPTADGPLADPLVALPENRLAAPGSCHALLFELHVPHGFPPGRHRGQLEVIVGGDRVTLALDLRVWRFTLPDRLSFLPEMNAYNLPDPPLEVDYYRLAHRHRTCLNRLHYGWRGDRVVCPPAWDGKGFDFRAWDRRFGPLLDGSAFADLPRAGEPVDHFYLPLNENWPVPVEGGFRGGYWADRAFTPAYTRQFRRACAAFARHLDRKGWHRTRFQFYLNNKVYYKKADWRRCSAPWILDEPVHTQDFLALAWFGRQFHHGVYGAAGKARLAFRCDISRPQWQRNLLNGLLGVNVCGDAFYRHRRRVLARRERWGETVQVYGATGPVTGSAWQPLAWCLDAWTLGVDGVLPWQTVGRAASWTRADPLALFYPGPTGEDRRPVPSIRLKGYRRGQQLTEYLALAVHHGIASRGVLGRVVRRYLGLPADLDRQPPPGLWIRAYPGLDANRIHRLRRSLGRALDRLSPPYRRQLALRPSPAVDPDRLPRFVPMRSAPPVR